MNPILETTQLTLQLGTQTICQKLNLTIQVGETWGVLGPNGSGKTTLLRALSGLTPIQHGNILLHGLPLHAFTPADTAKHIGFLFQDQHTALPLTVWEYCVTGRYPHLGYFGKLSKQDIHIVRQALQKMELDTLQNRPIQRLSGGEKQRAAIAAILAQSPDLYLLDEPLNHLDVRHQMQTLALLRELTYTKQKAVMLSMHDLNLAADYCDRVLLLFPNGDIEQGKPASLFTQENLTQLYKHPMVAAEKTYWLATI